MVQRLYGPYPQQLDYLNQPFEITQSGFDSPLGGGSVIAKYALIAVAGFVAFKALK